MNPATGPETLGIAYDYETKTLHRLENAQIYSFFEKKTDCYTITVSPNGSRGLIFAIQGLQRQKNIYKYKLNSLTVRIVNFGNVFICFIPVFQAMIYVSRIEF